MALRLIYSTLLKPCSEDRTIFPLSLYHCRLGDLHTHPPGKEGVASSPAYTSQAKMQRDEGKKLPLILCAQFETPPSPFFRALSLTQLTLASAVTGNAQRFLGVASWQPANEAPAMKSCCKRLAQELWQRQDRNPVPQGSIQQP